MDKQFSTTVLVVTIGVLLGVGFVVKQNNDSLVKQVLDKQNALLDSQSRLEKGLGSEAPSSKLMDLEKRIMVLELQLKAVQDLAKQGIPSDNNQPVRQAPPPEDVNKVYEIEIGDSPVLGSKDAPVMIVEFSDLQCPFCSRFHGPVMEAVKQYPGKVSYMLKNFPLSFHQQAVPAARATLAAKEQGKYFEMVDAILTDNKDLSDDRLKALAKQIGLNEKKFWDDFTGKAAEYDAIIQKDMQLGSSVDVRGTPTFFINGKKTFARDTASYKREIDQILNQGK